MAWKTGTRQPRRLPGLLAIGALAIALAVPLVLISSSSLVSVARPATAGALVTEGNNTCRCVPEALYITNAAPTIGVTTGDLINVTYEWEIPHFKPSDAGVLIHIPSIVTNFTLIKHPNLIIDFPQRNETIAGAGWSNSSLAFESKMITAHYFFSSKLAYISTQRLAVMANVTYGTLRLEFRWQWSVYKPNLSQTTTGNWSTNYEGLHHQDLVTPAPLVYLSPTTVRTMAVGSIFTARLTGLVANQGEWLLEMEYPNGSVTTQEHEWGPNGTTQYFNATLPMTTVGSRLPPGQYLVHVHGPHSGILFSITVHLTAPTTGTLAVTVVPSGCGPVVINGTAVTSGGNATFPVGAVTLTAPSCLGYTFHAWSQVGGGIAFTAPRKATTNATLYYNATLTATYT